jgi:integrase
MGRNNKPWQRKDTKVWYVTIDGVRHLLGKNKETAFTKFHALMANETRQERISVFELMDEFLDWTQNHRASETYEGYKKLLKRFVDDNRDRDTKELKPFHVQKWLDKQEWGNTYKCGMVTAIKRCFNWARKQGYISENPIQNLEKPKANRREKPVTSQEYASVLKLVKKSDPFYDVVVFSWETGSRPQESLRFTASDIKGDKIVMANPKAKGPRYRTIHLSDKAKKIVQKHRKQNPEGAVFRNSRGNPWTPNACSNRFDRMKDEIGRTIALYDFRHGYATDLLKSGVDPVSVAELLGHKDLTMLMQIYQHISDDDEFLRKQLKKRK